MTDCDDTANGASAVLRSVRGSDGVTYLALPDVAALLLTAASTVEGTAVPADDALRSVSLALDMYQADMTPGRGEF